VPHARMKDVSSRLSCTHTLLWYKRLTNQHRLADSDRVYIFGIVRGDTLVFSQACSLYLVIRVSPGSRKDCETSSHLCLKNPLVQALQDQSLWPSCHRLVPRDSRA